MGLGSGIRDPEKTYSESRGQNGTGSRIRNTAGLDLDSMGSPALNPDPDPGGRK